MRATYGRGGPNMVPRNTFVKIAILAALGWVLSGVLLASLMATRFEIAKAAADDAERFDGIAEMLQIAHKRLTAIEARLSRFEAVANPYEPPKALPALDGMGMVPEIGR